MAKGLGSTSTGKLAHNTTYETYYHTFRIRSGSRTFIFHGAKSSLNDALETIQEKTKSPYKPSYKEV